jgi:Flp pilus assembly protein TadG
MFDDDYRYTRRTAHDGYGQESYYWRSQMTRRLGACSKGAVAVMTAIVFPILLGFTGMGVEVGHWYLAQRQMQGSADAAAISAAAQYIADFTSNPDSTTYKTVGAAYAAANGFTIPTANVCLMKVDGSDDCGPVLALDAREIVCNSRPCIVVEITQNTLEWLTTQMSLKPTATGAGIEGIPTPTLLARAVVSATITTMEVFGTDCILALANAADAILVHGNGDLRAACGIAVDGGIEQNENEDGPLGGITFDGANSAAHINTLVVAAESTGCPSEHCFLYNPSTTPLPASAVSMSTGTPDPFASTPFPTFPLGVQTGGVTLTTQGTGYTPGTRTFTVVGGTGTPAKFRATVPSSGANAGKVTAIQAVIDPGAYTVFPTGTITATPDTGGGSDATFTLTEGCFSWNTALAPLPGRTYCSIKPSGTISFPTGEYYIAGGDNDGCGGFCMSGGGNHVTSDAAGVTFYLGNGYGANSRGATVTAIVSISGFGGGVDASTLVLCAPGTSCGTGCTGSCQLFMQNPEATESTAQSVPDTTVNSFSGNGDTTISGLVYLPKQTFRSDGNSEIQGCFGVVAKYVDVGGTPTFTNGCLPGNGTGSDIITVLINPYLAQ